VDEVLPLFGGYADAPWAEGTNPLPLSPHYAFYETRNDSAAGLCREALHFMIECTKKNHTPASWYVSEHSVGLFLLKQV